MAISVEHVGRAYPATVPYEVSRAKIAEFAQALGDNNQAYVGTHPIAPPTFSAVIASQSWAPLFADPDLEMSLDRTIHADQRFDFIRPLRAGDVVQATLTIEKVRTRGNTDMVTIQVALVTVDGDPICTAQSQLIHTRPDQETTQTEAPDADH